MEQEQPMQPDKFGPLFLSKRSNKLMYKAQMYRSTKLAIKVNKWELNRDANLPDLRRTLFKSIASSRLKGFMWLLVSHALPVETRCHREDTTLDKCLYCGAPEDIKHMAYGCKRAKDRFRNSRGWRKQYS